MPTATLTSKGQITIPLALRTALGLHPGSRLDFIRDANGFTAVTVQLDAKTSLKGRFSRRTPGPVSIADMNDAIGEEAASRDQAARKSKQ